MEILARGAKETHEGVELCRAAIEQGRVMLLEADGQCLLQHRAQLVALGDQLLRRVGARARPALYALLSLVELVEARLAELRCRGDRRAARTIGAEAGPVAPRWDAPPPAGVSVRELGRRIYLRR
ncbi:MAG: hypothetical protein U1E65_26210 [Myxococcota bacterium]